jgi:hypothetical protein
MGLAYLDEKSGKERVIPLNKLARVGKFARRGHCATQ